MQLKFRSEFITDMSTSQDRIALATLRLDRARMHLIAAFVDSYLRLNADEEAIFRQTLADTVPAVEAGEIMVVVPSAKYCFSRRDAPCVAIAEEEI